MASSRSALLLEPRSVTLLPARFDARPDPAFYEELDHCMAPGFGLMRTLTGTDRWPAPVPALHHHHLTSLGAVSIEYPPLRPAIPAKAATPRAYSSVARATREFLDAFVKEEGTAGAGFGPGAPGSIWDECRS